MIDQKSITRWIFFLLVVLCAGDLLADGKYWPSAAYKKAPDIPGQKAVLIYKDGVEKLIIESSLEGEGKEFGWIIPLPNKPEKFEVASAGFIQTLSIAVQPEVTNEGIQSQGLIAILLSAVFITISCLMLILTAPENRKKRLLSILILFIVLLLLLAILAPALGTVGIDLDIQQVEGVTVHDVQSVGSYDLNVIEAEESDALDKWLTTNGFAGLSEKEKSVIADYIKDGWYFVASKLRRDSESGYLRPHPLAMSFKTDKPVYPYRLTALANNDVYLELYIIADKTAKCEQLTLEVSDTYNFKEDSQRNHLSKLFDVEESKLAGFVGKEFDRYIKIGHPNAKEYMWDNCVLSRLCGTIAVGSIDDDLEISLKKSASYRKHYYSKKGALGAAFDNCLLVWYIILLVATGIYVKKARELNERIKAVLRIFVIAAAALPITGLITYLTLPKVGVEIKSFIAGPSILSEMIITRDIYIDNDFILEEHPDIKEMSKEQVVEILVDFYKSFDKENMFTGQKIIKEDSPGNYTVYEDERGVVIRRYSMHGYPLDWVVGTELN